MNAMLPTFKALSDGNRLRVMAALLTRDELCACQIIELLQVTGATASRHMGVLLSAGLVSSRKDGRWVYYTLSPTISTFAPVLDWMKKEFKKVPEIQNDKKTLKEITSCDPEEICRRQRGEDCCPIK